jgi:magnesium chelatase family protein
MEIADQLIVNSGPYVESALEFDPSPKTISRVANAFSVALVGLNGYLVDAQAINGSGRPTFRIIGLPDASLSQSTDRIRSAYLSCKLKWTKGVMVVNLAPAYVPKKGSSFDLAIFIATLRVLKHVKSSVRPRAVFFGELGLDGRIHPIRGILPMVSTAVAQGYQEIVVCEANADEARLIPGAEVFGFGHVAQIVDWLGGTIETPQFSPVTEAKLEVPTATVPGCFSDVIGQAQAKWALEIAAAGGHHLLMVGPPGTGKSMLASRLPTIMPDLNPSESLAVSSIHSVADGLPNNALITVPPFEAPHHSATAPAIIGGGQGIPRPGAVSKAHCGILFMDEAPEFSPQVLQTLRQPLETGYVVIDRAQGSAKYPSAFQLVMAANPCPCGMNFGSGLHCNCTQQAKRRYFTRLSGPLLDRVDLHIQVDAVKIRTGLLETGDTSVNIKSRVMQARERCRERLKSTPWTKNSQVPGSYYRKLLSNAHPILNSLNSAVDKGYLTLRGADRCLRIAWTLADLDARSVPELADLECAFQLRQEYRPNV